MTRILVYEPAFRRIESRLPASAGQAEFLLVDKDGKLRLGDRDISMADARPDAGWMSVDMFGSSAARGEWFSTLLKSSQLKWVQSAAAGFDDPAFKRLVANGARLTTNSAQAVSMAEYVLWGVLDHFQRGPERRTAQAANEWARLRYRDVSGSRWLVIGFGAIGQAVAVRAAAFGAVITGVRRSGGTHPAANAIATPDRTQALLAENDVVVLAVPLSLSTQSLVDETFLAAMKPGSVLVNVGRGGLIDEGALLAALDRGAPGHAILDVFREEPLPRDSPFWANARVSLTGHASAMGSGFAGRADDLFLENLDRYLTGRPLLNEAAAADVLAE